MLDRRFIVENAEAVRRNCANRGVKVDLDRFLAIEADWKARQAAVEELNRRANEVSKSIGKAKDPAEREARKAEGRRLREETSASEAQIGTLAAEMHALQLGIPNMAHPDAPVGTGEANREVGRGRAAEPKFGFQPSDHVELGERLDLMD